MEVLVTSDSPPEGTSRISDRFSRFRQPLSRTTSSSQLCNYCLGLRFNHLRSGQHYSHGTLAEVIASAEAGCRLCNILKEFDSLLPPQLARLNLYGIRKSLSCREKDYLVEEGDVENIGVRDAMETAEGQPFYMQLALYADKGLLRSSNTFSST